MLADREYMRDPSGYESRWRTLTAKLLILNLAIYIAQVTTGRSFDWEGWLGLSYAGLSRGYVWQLVTYQFLHASPLHLILNSIGVFAFGFAVEQHLGKRRFLTLYLASGILGGLVQALGSLVWPSHFGVLRDALGNLYYTPMVGASAGLFGLIAAFATMFPERNLTVLLFFILPVTVSARVLLGVSALVSVVGVLIDRSNVAHAAHAGGMLGGWLMLRYYATREQKRYAADSRPARRTAPTPSAPPTALDAEVDVILEKISARGIQSLTERERRTLQTARERMR
jgi:membrane associated rhomboid family serine protease